MIRGTVILALSLVGIVGAPSLNGQEQDTQGQPSKRKLPPGFFSKSLRLPSGTDYKYVVFVPAHYEMNKDHRWPMIVFLHGSGEMGEDGIRQTTVGLPVHISMRPTTFPFIVLMPQAHAMWFRGQEAEAVWRMIAATKRDYRVDDDRVSITGLSMGGYGAWELAITQPDAFSAIVPVCGAAPIEFLCNVRTLPSWAFHGALDKHVPVSGSRDAIKELKRLGGITPRYSEYADLPHECWDKAYSEEELYKWLLVQKRTVPRVIDYRIPHGVNRVWWLAVRAEPNLRAPAHIRAEIGEKGHITVETEGIEDFGLISDGEPLKPGDEIQVTWNGAVVFRGTFKGALRARPDRGPDEPTPAPVLGRTPQTSAPEQGATSRP